MEIAAVSVAALRYLSLTLASVAILLAIVVAKVPTSWFRPFDVIGARQYLLAISFMQIAIIIMIIWWFIYLPSPERWYLTCCRTSLAMFFVSVTSAASSIIPDKASVSLPGTGTFDWELNKPGWQLVALAVLAAACLGHFSRRYTHYRALAMRAPAAPRPGANRR